MVPDDDADNERWPGGPPLPPEDRLWRHPSELGGTPPATHATAAAPLGAASTVHRTSNRGVLAGACLAGLLMAFGTFLITRPAPDERGPRPFLTSGVSVSVATSVVAPAAVAASPLQRVQAPVGNVAAPGAEGPTGPVDPLEPGRLGVNVADGLGAVVVEVHPSGAAHEAGLAEGDVIVAVDGQIVTSGPALVAALDQTAPGQQVRLTVRRDHDLLRVPVELR